MMFVASKVYHESASCRVDREQKTDIVISHIGGMLLKQNIPEWNMLLMIGLT